jgi:hypothetical protein
MTTGLLAVRSSIDPGGPPGSRSCRKNETGMKIILPGRKSPARKEVSSKPGAVQE